MYYPPLHPFFRNPLLLVSKNMQYFPFNYEVYGLELETVGTTLSPSWAVLVKHEQGVACATISLP
ncbi:MAG: hypothetical protein Fur0022_40720 [Anaerolineales bacterium]